MTLHIAPNFTEETLKQELKEWFTFDDLQKQASVHDFGEPMPFDSAWGTAMNGMANMVAHKPDPIPPPQEANYVPPITMDGVLIEHCGSTYTCNPAPTDTDVDFLAYCSSLDYVLSFEHLLGKSGYKASGLSYEGSGFISWKKTEANGVTYNYLVTTKLKWFTAFIRARELCKTLNLMKKPDRIAVHTAFLEEIE